ncbi:hypothetical protein BC939DRAFT_457791 [Gamsiella multidivaricata]|uniref:uncharacterized protein n=1 Tax=Gamsiella multidivaricata TaxID=101098 RepID=UPI00221F5C2B|nr:uncharacterized protein BC939DRAFT_457791 [Gamsiella multidivaricata]KAI7820580.1 hypothetical protein BC939DRAFT_457791 [Gamsiella multidivaricata]
MMVVVEAKRKEFSPEVLMAAAEALDPLFGTEEQYETVREHLELAYDRSIKKDEIYFDDYYTQRRSQLDVFESDREKLDKRFPPSNSII